MNRLYGEKQPLDYTKVAGFFERRSRRIAEVGPLAVTMYQTNDVAERRDAYEKETVLPYLGVGSRTRVLDIGCGTGRWGMALCTMVAGYLGTDFCDVYIQAGRDAFRERALDFDRFGFQKLQATAVARDTLTQAPPFDLIIIAGLLAFLNDDDVVALLERVAELAAPNATVYLRELLAIAERITLLEYPSEQLDDDYNVVYRTDREIQSFLGRTLLQGKGCLKVKFPLFPLELQSPGTRNETEQYVYIIEMPA